MVHVYTILYQQGGNIDEPETYFRLRLAEVGASSSRKAREIFKRHHAPENRIIKVELKRVHAYTKGVKV